MVSTKRILEAFNFYAFKEPSSEESSIERFIVLRERLGKILKSSKLRSIQMVMGSDMLPFQNVVAKMSEEEFSEFIADNTFGSRRKEIYLKYKYKKSKCEDIYEDRVFSFQLNTTFIGATKVINELKRFLKTTDWAYESVKYQLVK